MIETKRKSQMIYIFQSVSSLGEATGSLENFTHLILLPRNYILIIPIGIYCASNFEARIVCLNVLEHNRLASCLQYEGGTPKAPLCPIVATTLLDLLHVDFTSIETTIKLDQSPRVANILVSKTISLNMYWCM